MALFVLKKINVFFSVFTKNEIPCIFSQLYFSNDIPLAGSNRISGGPHTTAGCEIYSLNYYIPYLRYTLKNTDALHKRIFQANFGYAIMLQHYTSADDYLKIFSSRNSKRIKNYRTRLEASFTIHYRTFFGEIENSEYRRLFARLKDMIVERFKQRGEINERLKDWNSLEPQFLELILLKKASIFVIYNEDLPIQISLSYHFKNVLFSAISSYDIDYEKFGLGHVHFYKKIEWCIKQGILVIDMGMGDLTYKDKWCNHRYSFEHLLFTTKNTIWSFLGIYILWVFYTIKELLKKYKVEEFIRMLKGKIKGPKKVEFYNAETVLNLTLERAPNENELVKIDVRTQEFKFLRRNVYEFLFTQKNHIRDIEVYRHLGNPDSYILTNKQTFIHLKKV